MTSRTGSMLALAGVVLIGMTGFGVFLPIFPFLSLASRRHADRDDDRHGRLFARPIDRLAALGPPQRSRRPQADPDHRPARRRDLLSLDRARRERL